MRRDVQNFRVIIEVAPTPDGNDTARVGTQTSDGQPLDKLRLLKALMAAGLELSKRQEQPASAVQPATAGQLAAVLGGR